MDRSVAETSSSSAVANSFDNSILYPNANLKSKLAENNIEKFPTKYKTPTSSWGVYAASRTYRIYDNPEVPESLGGIATGIFEAAFKYSFRIPMLPVLKKLLKR